MAGIQQPIQHSIAVLFIGHFIIFFETKACFGCGISFFGYLVQPEITYKLESFLLLLCRIGFFAKQLVELKEAANKFFPQG